MFSDANLVRDVPQSSPCQVSSRDDTADDINANPLPAEFLRRVNCRAATAN
jgi:hypothetical protein